MEKHLSKRTKRDKIKKKERNRDYINEKRAESGEKSDATVDLLSKFLSEFS